MRQKSAFLSSNKYLKWIFVFLLLVPYLLYVSFIIKTDRGPVDYETFMDIGHRLLTKSEIYGVNSYYPMPYVIVFALFSWLPRPVSIAIWLLAPVICALFITGANPLALLFAPLFGHFVGGQSAIFGMLGLWGYRRSIDTSDPVGGLFLGLTMFKPQLGIVPLVYAMMQWLKAVRTQKRIPQQAWTFIITILVLYLPGFFFIPDWPYQWLSHPRPLFERAMSGFIPRTLLYIISPQTITYWIIVIIAGGLLLLGIWFLNGKVVDLDLAVMWSFIVSPLVHDYDLIQLIPLLDKPYRLATAILFSIPGWLVILFAYSSNIAWYAFSIIAPGILGVWLCQKQKSKRDDCSPEKSHLFFVK
jgi:hypothetical protein